MTMLLAAAAFFASLHLIVSGTKLRDGIVGAIGEGAYLGLFSLVSVGAIVWLVVSYNAAFLGDNRLLWDLGVGVRHMGIPVVFIAAMLAVIGLLTPNPTSVKQEGVLDKAQTFGGVLKITRHPFLWGVTLWASFHLLTNGDVASVVFFGTFAVVAFLGTFSIDAKRRRALGDKWNVFSAATSNVPFLAMIGGRSSGSLAEIGAFRVIAAFAVFGVLLFGHAWALGASPFPSGWVPF